MKTLDDFLKTAGIRLDAAPQQPKQAAAPAKPAQPKQAADTSAASQPSHGEAPGGHKPRQDHTDAEVQDTGATGGQTAAQAAPAKEAQVEAGQVLYDRSLIKTAAQEWCLEQGMLVPDEKVAERLFNESQMAEQAQQKQAEAEKRAMLEEQGKILFQGMLKESAAYELARGEMTLEDATKVARYLGCGLDGLCKEAREIKQAMTDVEVAAVPNDIFFAGQKGMAARTGSSRVLQAAAQNGATTEFEPEAVGGTRQPAHGPDENTRRFVDTATMPGNPGLNHGQEVDQGKGLGQ